MNATWLPGKAFDRSELSDYLNGCQFVTERVHALRLAARFKVQRFKVQRRIYSNTVPIVPMVPSLAVRRGKKRIRSTVQRFKRSTLD
jgi:hypothetical protein